MIDGKWGVDAWALAFMAALEDTDDIKIIADFSSPNLDAKTIIVTPTPTPYTKLDIDVEKTNSLLLILVDDAHSVWLIIKVPIKEKGFGIPDYLGEKPSEKLAELVDDKMDALMGEIEFQDMHTVAARGGELALKQVLEQLSIHWPEQCIHSIRARVLETMNKLSEGIVHEELLDADMKSKLRLIFKRRALSNCLVEVARQTAAASRIQAQTDARNRFLLDHQKRKELYDEGDIDYSRCEEARPKKGRKTGKRVISQEDDDEMEARSDDVPQHDGGGEDCVPLGIHASA